MRVPVHRGRRRQGGEARAGRAAIARNGELGRDAARSVRRRLVAEAATARRGVAPEADAGRSPARNRAIIPAWAARAGGFCASSAVEQLPIVHTTAKEARKHHMAMERPRFDPRQQQRGPQIRSQPPHPRAGGARHRRRRRDARRAGDARGAAQGAGAGARPRRGQPQGRAAGLQDPRLRQVQVRREEEGRARRSASRRVVEIKEIKLRPKTDDHDLAFKISAARRFLEAGTR